MKKLIAASIASIGLAASMPSSAAIVGGVDFGSSGNTHIETATLAETFINGANQTLYGYGLVTTVNGDTTYCADGTSNCSLYFTFDYRVASFNGITVTFDTGNVNLYYSGSPALNLHSQDSTTNVGLIQGMTPWLHLTGHAFVDPVFNIVNGTPGASYELNGFGLLTGSSLSETGQGQLDVAAGWGMAAVATFLDGNSEADGLGGFSDIVVTSSTNSSVLNPFDLAGTLADSCRNPTTGPQVGDWCLQGTMNTRGQTVPEPSTLALAGLSMLGIAALRRRKQNQA